jgi:hypothetical protein
LFHPDYSGPDRSCARDSTVADDLEDRYQMTPYELAKTIYRDVGGVAPKFAAALNRALVDIGEGSLLVGLQPGSHVDDDVTFHETEKISVSGAESAGVLAKLYAVASSLEEHSSWRIIIDKKPDQSGSNLELLYTFYRDRTHCGQ